MIGEPKLIKLTAFKWNEHQSVSQIREATRGDPVLSRAMYFILHGWPAEHCISDELNLLQ